MSWSEYVSVHAPRNLRSVISRATVPERGSRPVVGQPMISQWANGKASPGRPVYVAAFARACGLNVLEAFVAAGFLTAEEAGMSPSFALTDDELLDEMRGRLARAGRGVVVTRSQVEAADLPRQRVRGG